MRWLLPDTGSISIGFTGGDAETKAISNGSTFTAFSVATQRSWKNSEGAWESRTEWHRCVSFGKLADFAATLKKGAHVQVEGELRGREYEKHGVKHKVFDCRLESILKLDRAERRGADESDGQAQRANQQRGVFAASGEFPSVPPRAILSESREEGGKACSRPHAFLSEACFARRVR
jgi:single-strand DNA-binding protein